MRSDRADLVAWNCETDNTDEWVKAGLTGWEQAYRPDAFLLSEAASHYNTIATWCRRNGFQHLQEQPRRGAPRGDDTGDTAILVRNEHRVRRDWVMAMLLWWTVLRYNRRHQPHRYQAAVAVIRGRTWRLLSVHPPTNGFDGGNAEAFTESAVRIRRWLSWGRHPSAAVGDWNEHLERLADWLPNRFRLWGHGIDLAATANVVGGSYAALGSAHSDHRGRWYRLRARPR